MKNTNYTPVVLFAINGKSQAEDLEMLSLYAPEVNPEPLIGSWECVQENSYMISLEEWTDNVAGLTELMLLTDQDAIMLLDNKRTAHIATKENNYCLCEECLDKIGRFTGVSEFIALQQDGWTFSPRLQQYYTVL